MCAVEGALSGNVYSYLRYSAIFPIAKFSISMGDHRGGGKLQGAIFL